MIKKALHTSLFIILPGLLVLVASFSLQHNRQRPPGELHLRLAKGEEIRFADPAALQSELRHYLAEARADNMLTADAIMANIRQRVLLNPYISDAAVYQTIDGEIRVDISQHEALIRVISRNNESFYISRTKHILPHSSDYTPRVMVAGGNIQSPARAMESGLFELAAFIDRDEFLRAFIDQVYITARGEFELVPRNGAHIIELGDTSQLYEKFSRLQVFYQKGIPQKGWNYYRRINLRYQNQVVCSK